jgi:SdpI/YfhL protein family
VLVPAIIEMVAGLVCAWLASAMWRERLPRNGIAGVRTASTMRSDEAFRIGNKAAAPLTAAGAAVLIVGGALAAVGPHKDAGIPIFGGVLLFLALAIWGGIKGSRACR